MASPPSPANQNQQEMVVLERIRVVRSGLMKLDLETVRLRINDHNFCISFLEFVQMLDALADNCAEFQATRMHSAGEAAN